MSYSNAWFFFRFLLWFEQRSWAQGVIRMGIGRMAVAVIVTVIVTVIVGMVVAVRVIVRVAVPLRMVVGMP